MAVLPAMVQIGMTTFSCYCSPQRAAGEREMSSASYLPPTLRSSRHERNFVCRIVPSAMVLPANHHVFRTTRSVVSIYPLEL